MKTDWQGEPLNPASYDDLPALAKLAREARDRLVDFDWELSRGELVRLREAVHLWGAGTRGRYKKFDAQMLAAINDALGEPNSEYSLQVPGGTEGVDSVVCAERVGDRFRLTGHATFDVLFGYGREDPDSGAENVARLGEELTRKLQEAVGQLDWDLKRLGEERFRPVVNTLFGLPPDYGIETPASLPEPTDTMELRFHGPFHWRRDRGLRWVFGDELSLESGIYLWTVPWDNKEWVHYVGQTGRSFALRFTEHVTGYLSGQYSILDASDLARGQQTFHWRAVGGNEPWGAKQAQFLDRYELWGPKLRELLDLFRFYLAPVSGDKGLCDRIEGALGEHFRDHESAEVRARLVLGSQFPWTSRSERNLLCRLVVDSPIAGLPGELAV